ncbi:hypothetical protein V8C86DRAFT_3139400 [Haematococcus lacustris]
MGKRRRLCLVTKEGGTAAVAPAAAAAPPPAPSLLELPIALLDDIVSQAMQLGSTSALARTCSALYDRVLLHTPALRIQLNSQRRDQLLAPRIITALRARTSKLALVLEQHQQQLHQQHIEEWLAMMGSCSAVQACKLHSTRAFSLLPMQPLTCTPHLAQRLHDTFPSLTSLSLTGYSVTHSGLASLLSHPQLALLLQHLDITGTTIMWPPPPDEPGAVTLNNLFQGLRLKQLSLDVREESPLPNLQPLAQHLTQLHIRSANNAMPFITAAVGFLPLLQVLTSSCGVMFEHNLLPQLVQAMPHLHTLHLPEVDLWTQQQLDALLAATQLTSIQLFSIEGLSSSRADAPCSWQRLELTAGSFHTTATTAAYLPLHSLTHPLLFDSLGFDSQDSTALVTAAVHNLTQTCKVPVKVKGCTHLEFFDGRLTPSLKFWRQLVQLLPTVSQVTFYDVKGASSAAMCQSLRSMAKQPWARWLDIKVVRNEQSLSAGCQAINEEFRHPSQPQKFRVSFQHKYEF